MFLSKPKSILYECLIEEGNDDDEVKTQINHTRKSADNFIDLGKLHKLSKEEVENFFVLFFKNSRTKNDLNEFKSLLEKSIGNSCQFREDGIIKMLNDFESTILVILLEKKLSYNELLDYFLIRVGCFSEPAEIERFSEPPKTIENDRLSYLNSKLGDNYNDSSAIARKLTKLLKKYANVT